MVLYLENLCLTEKSRIFIPQARQAPERVRLQINRYDRITYKENQRQKVL
jgi:hypothetical protein